MEVPDLQRYPWKLCLNKYELDINAYFSEKWLFIFNCGFSTKVTISTTGKHTGIIRIKHF